MIRAAVIASYRTALRAVARRVSLSVARGWPEYEERFDWSPATAAGWFLLESASVSQALEHVEQTRELLLQLQAEESRRTDPAPASAQGAA